MERNKSSGDVHDELRRIAPGLEDLKKDDGFTAPHNYFRELPDRIILRLSEEKRHVSAWPAWLGPVWRPRLAYALVGVLALVVAGVLLTRPSTEPDPIAAITEKEALEYVMTHLHEYSQEELMSLGAAGSWEAESLIRVSDEHVDEMIDDILENPGTYDIEDLF